MHLEREGTGVGLLHDGQVDHCPGWFQVLIYNQSSTDNFPGLLQVLIWDLKRLQKGNRVWSISGPYLPTGDEGIVEHF